MSDLMARLNLSQKNGVIVAEFTESKLLEEMKISQVQEGLLGLVKGKERPLLLLDFANVDYFSSAALGMLVAVNDSIKKQNGQMRLVNVRPQIMQVFTLTKLDRVLKISATRDGAMSILARLAEGLAE